MEEKSLVLCDSDVLIEIFDRNNSTVITKLASFGTQNLCISSVSFSEILFGANDRKHFLYLRSKLESFLLLELRPEIDLRHRNLILNYSLSHGLRIQDALIAATALTYEIPIYTLNAKDFRFIKGLRLL
jgi:tRNA(fMet)-specific endonuclease VapC